jgi:hypothetical protein
MDADHRPEVASPLGVGQAVARCEHLDPAGLVAGTALLVDRAGTVERRGGVAQAGEGVMQAGLVGFDLGDQVSAARGGLREGFF